MDSSATVAAPESPAYAAFGVPADHVIGFHFLSDDGRLYGNGHLPESKRVKVEVGSELRVEPPLKLCRRGLHGAVRAIDSLRYAPGALVTLCDYGPRSAMLFDTDKFCGPYRRVLAMADATALLHEFACWCAERALARQRAQGYEPDPRSWAAIGAKRDRLAGKMDDRQLAAAWAAPRDAAGDAAWAAAWDAAGDAAGDAAWAAAWDAAWAAAWDAAWAEQNAELEARLYTLLGLSVVA